MKIRKGIFIISILTVMVLTGCNRTVAEYDIETQNTIVEKSNECLGIEFKLGGSSPDEGFDCSGLVCYIMNESNVLDSKRVMAQELYELSEPISKEELKAGDLIFFRDTFKSPNIITHVGIYVGEGEMIHCGNASVEKSELDTDYWQNHFEGYGRLKKEK